jgi:hypothetical protein
LTVQSNVVLAEGSREEVTLELVPDPNATAGSPAAAPPAPVAMPDPAPPPPTAASKKPNTAGYVLIGVGAAGIVTGSVTGLLAIGKKNNLDCPDKECPPDEHDQLDGAKGLALVATIGFGVGIAGIAAGTIVLLSAGGQEPPPRATLPKPHARPFLRGHTIGIEGSF